jgi:hypothetical protein
MRQLLLLVIALATGACNLPGNVACTLEARAAVSAEITNVVDGPYGLAYERAGTYTVTVEQQGYRPWSRSGVRVTKDECHVRGVSITARLQW